MRIATAFTLVAIVAISAGCGGASAPVGGGGGDSILSLSFGSGAPPIIPVPGEVPVRIFNFSNAQILDLGYRSLFSTDAFQGGIAGLTPAQQGQISNGSIEWVSLEQGGYEIFVETDRGTLHAQGFVGTVEIPDGVDVNGNPKTRTVLAPSDLYIFEFDFDAPQGGNPNPQGGNQGGQGQGGQGQGGIPLPGGGSGGINPGT